MLRDFVEQLLLFLLGLRCLLCFLRFLGHVALRDPQSWLNAKSTIDVHRFRLHHNFKIDTACFEEGKRPSDSRDRNWTKTSRGAWAQRALAARAFAN